MALFTFMLCYLNAFPLIFSDICSNFILFFLLTLVSEVGVEGWRWGNMFKAPQLKQQFNSKTDLIQNKHKINQIKIDKYVH